MIPLYDDNPTKTKPYITMLFIALNIAIFLLDRLGASGPVGNLFNFSMVPAAVLGQKAIMVPIAKNQAGQILTYTYNGLQPQWLTIFTSMFMHGSIFHIGGNMLYLWIFGNNIEDKLGHFKYFFFYLACGFLASCAHIFFNSNSIIPTLGASGAVAGVLGAYLILFPSSTVRSLVFLGFLWFLTDVPAIWLLGIWFVSQLLGVGGSGGLQGGVAYWAHIGGFIAGIVLIKIISDKPKYNNRYYSEH